nr:hypothetical protein [Microbacterium testaceum]
MEVPGAVAAQLVKEWHESQEHVDRNNELLAAVNAQQVKLWEAELDRRRRAGAHRKRRGGRVDDRA